MKFDLNKYIKNIKNNKKLLLPIGVLLVVFLYSALGDFFKLSSKKPADTGGGNITLEDKFYTKDDIEKANSKVVENNEEQRKLLVEEENEIENRAKDNNNASYMKKTILGNEIGNELKIQGINEKNSLNSLNSQNENLPAGCKKDFVTNVVVCLEPNGESKFLVNGAKISLNKTLCETSPYNATSDCINLLSKIEEENKKIQIKEQQGLNLENDVIDKKTGKTQSSSKKVEDEHFGSKEGSKSFQKNAMLLGLLSNDEKAFEAQKGSSYAGVSNILDRKDAKDKSKNSNNIEDKEPKLFVKPGSSYIGTLINPLNSLYSQVKPIINIENGDLKGYRIVGEISSNEASGGLIITASKLVSPLGVEESISSVAIRSNDGELTPLFVDEIDRHLMGKIGYTVLGALSNDYASQVSGNNSKDNNSINFGETTSSETGDQLSSTFSEIANQYKTEIKVNPQTMIVIFY